MSTSFLSKGVWSQLTRAARESRQRCAVAVAYFGKGASRLLPLSKGSRLVVDASEGAVTSGQTCPADLVRMVKRGVAVYSVPNLHAKVFVLGRAAFTGSTNASNRSAYHLVEAVIRTTEPSAIRAARGFVTDLCLHELTPERIRQLAKLYQPPLIPGGKRKHKGVKSASLRPSLPRVLLAQLELGNWSQRDDTLHEAGMLVAKKRREHPRRFELDSFRMTGTSRYRPGDVVIQVTDEGSGGILVTPPGNVLYMRSRGEGRKRVTFIYLERPVRRRRQVKSLARALGCTQKRLREDHVVKDQAFAQALLNALTVTK